jgi:hypothetical protein
MEKKKKKKKEVVQELASDLLQGTLTIIQTKYNNNFCQAISAVIGIERQHINCKLQHRHTQFDCF